MQQKTKMAGQILGAIIFVAGILGFCEADVGTASRYYSPYLPSSCYGTEASEYPSSRLFAAAGEGIWDDGAACGRQYVVSCISATAPRGCIPGRTIQVKIVDRASKTVSPPTNSGATIVLSSFAFSLIARPHATTINVEFRQV